MAHGGITDERVSEQRKWKHEQNTKKSMYLFILSVFVDSMVFASFVHSFVLIKTICEQQIIYDALECRQLTV